MYVGYPVIPGPLNWMCPSGERIKIINYGNRCMESI